MCFVGQYPTLSVSCSVLLCFAGWTEFTVRIRCRTTDYSALDCSATCSATKGSWRISGVSLQCVSHYSTLTVSSHPLTVKIYASQDAPVI